METEKIIAEFNNLIDSLLKRVQINYVLCFSTKAEINKWNFDTYEKYLGDSNYKITVNSALFLNSIKDPYLLDEISETNDLNNRFGDFYNFIEEYINNLCKKGYNLYELNDLIREAIKKINEQISYMNYESWKEKYNVSNKENIFFLVIGNEKRTYKGHYFEIECGFYFENTFAFRKNLLNEMKCKLVDVYSEYLLLPYHSTLPVIEYTCSDSDICTLIKALWHSEYIIHNNELKSILLKLFSFNDSDFSRSSSEFSRKQIATKFLKEIITALLPPGSEIVKKKSKR